MSRRELRGRRWVTLMIAFIIGWWPVSTSLATSDDPPPDTSANSAPVTTTPETTQPDSTEPGTTDTGGVSDDDDATPLTWIAIVATVALLSVAAWWMVRSTGPDGPTKRMDDDWPDHSEVI